MLRRHCISAIALLAFLAGTTTAEEESVRDPWKGFGLGSWVSIKETREQTRDGKTTKHSSEKKYRVTGAGAHPAVTETEGAREGTQFHVDGKLPAEMGLKETGQSTEKVELDGQTLEATVVRYVSDPNDANLELLTKPLPEIWKQGGLKGDRTTTVRISLWKIQGSNIPYRELPLPGMDLALEPDVVRVDYEMLKPGKNGSVSSTKVKVVVRSKTAKQTVGERSLVCVEEETTGQYEVMNPDGTSLKGAMNDKNWLSNDVPGRVVRSTSNQTQSADTMAMTREVLGFESLKAETFDLAKLPPLAMRPAIPGNRWAGLHIGAWTMEFVINVFPNNESAFGSFNRVVSVRPNGELMIEDHEIDAQGNIGPATYRAENSKEPDEKYTSLASGEESVEIARKACATAWNATRLTRTDELGEGFVAHNTYVNLIWKPAKTEEQIAWLEENGPVQSLNYSHIHRPNQCSITCTLARVLERSSLLPYQGRKLDVVTKIEYETQGDEKGYPYESWKINLYSKNAPGQRVFSANKDLFNKGVTFSILIGWGEYEDPSPKKPEEIEKQLKACSDLLQAGMQTLNQLVADKDFSTAFIRDKNALEKRLLDLDKATPEKK